MIIRDMDLTCMGHDVSGRNGPCSILGLSASHI